MQAGGRRFDPVWLHHTLPPVIVEQIAVLACALAAVFLVTVPKTVPCPSQMEALRFTQSWEQAATSGVFKALLQILKVLRVSEAG